jgi:hypothetical protein
VPGLKKSLSALNSPDRHKTSRREGRPLTFLTDWLMTPRGWALELDIKKSVSALNSGVRTGPVPLEIKKHVKM